jgi:hypothetical protein
MADNSKGTDVKPKVFVSYSRRDLNFADQLVAVLEWQGFPVIIDRKGIHGAERWKERLGQLILESDVVVFLISPDSATSKICAWEVEEATRRRKRIVPALCRPLDGGAQPPARLRDLNYIYFYSDKDVPGSGFGTGQVQLFDALLIDVAWLREHTRWEELATHWHASGRSSDLLMRGSELMNYRQWRDNRPGNAPQLTDLQRAFLAASEDEEAARASAERKRLDEITAALLRAEEEKAALAGLIQRISAGKSTAPGIAAMKKICAEAVSVTASLANVPSDSAKRDRFWELYWGPMNLVEIRQKTDKYSGNTDDIASSPIESAMVRFGEALEALTAPAKLAAATAPARLAAAADDVKKECDAYLQ